MIRGLWPSLSLQCDVAWFSSIPFCAVSADAPEQLIVAVPVGCCCCCSCRPQVLGEVGALPDVFSELEVNFFLLRRLLGVRSKEGEKQSKVCGGGYTDLDR